jgi:hypothetical protein
MASIDSEESAFPFEEIDRVENTGRTVASGFGLVTGRLSKERQAKLDRQLSTLEAIGQGLKREGTVAHRQVKEILKETESVLGLFWGAVFEPEEFKKTHGLNEDGSVDESSEVHATEAPKRAEATDRATARRATDRAVANAVASAKKSQKADAGTTVVEASGVEIVDRSRGPQARSDVGGALVKR